MGTPNGAPGPEFVIDDLGWAELADIVWLASAVQFIGLKKG